jgi:hypothetical protein
MSKRAVTNINDLPDIMEIDNTQPIQQQPHYMKYDNMPNLEQRQVPEGIKKMIRPSQVINPDAGMTSYNNQMQPPPQQAPQPIPISSEIVDNRKEMNPLYDITCLQIAMHVKNCPICSNVYKSDSTIYILIIVILSILSLLLIKKITQ